MADIITDVEKLSVRAEEINIKKTVSTNRGTNSIWYNSIIACQVAAAAKKCGKDQNTHNADVQRACFFGTKSLLRYAENRNSFVQTQRYSAVCYGRRT